MLRKNEPQSSSLKSKSRERAKSIYDDGTYIDNNPTWHQEDSARKALDVLSLLSENNVLCSLGSIAEVGCGAGEILNVISKRLPNVQLIGFELSRFAFELCQTKQNDALHFFNEDITNTENFFDILLCIDVFEHVEDYMGFLRRIRAKSAFKVFRIPLDLSVNTLLRSSPLMEKRNSIGHLHYFTSSTAVATLSDCGYQIIDTKFVKCESLSLKSKLLDLLRFPLYRLNQDLCSRLLGGYSLLILAK